MNEHNEWIDMLSEEESASAGIQDVRSYLRSVRDAFRRTEVLCVRAERYREMLLRATGRMDGIRVTGGPKTNKVEACVVELVDTHNALQKEIQTLLARSREAEKLILRLQDERQRAVLQLRYLCGLGWEEVADKLHYTLRWTHKVHKEALEQLEGMVKGAE